VELAQQVEELLETLADGREGIVEPGEIVIPMLRQRRRQVAGERVQIERCLGETRFERRGVLLESGLLFEHREPLLLDVVLLLGGRLDEGLELADLALEQRELLLEDGLLRAPLGPELILLALEARPLLRERVDL